MEYIRERYRFRSWNELSEEKKQKVLNELRAEMEDPKFLQSLYDRFGGLEVRVRYMTNWFTRAEYEPRYEYKWFDKDDYDGAEAYLQYMKDSHEVLDARITLKIR